MEIQHRWNVDERVWREKVRRFEHENRKLKEELAGFLGHPADDEQVNALNAKIAALEVEHSGCLRTIEQQAAELKALQDKIKGLNMQLGRLKNKG